jgi:hypothetical protein
MMLIRSDRLRPGDGGLPVASTVTVDVEAEETDLQSVVPSVEPTNHWSEAYYHESANRTRAVVKARAKNSRMLRGVEMGAEELVLVVVTVGPEVY